MIEWTEDLNIGHPVIDADHRKLVDIINLFMASEGRLDERVILNNTLRLLVEYAKGHFAREEQIQREAMYPYMEMHVAEHKVLMVQLTGIVQSLFIEKSKPLDKHALSEVRGLLKCWLTDHIRKFDTNMRDWVAPSK